MVVPTCNEARNVEVLLPAIAAIRPAVSEIIVADRGSVDGTAEAAVPGPLDDADAVLVTREPRGGSQHPTSLPLLRADLR